MPGAAPQGFPNLSQPIAGLGGILTRPWLQLLISLWNRTGGASGSQIVPPGVIMDFAGPELNIPGGWLMCGQIVSRSEFANLFAAIGTTWGVGDGNSTFALPPQNIFAKGLGADAVGDTGGHASLTLTTAQLPVHNHGVTDPGHTHTVTDPKHTHIVTDPGHVHASVVADSINTTGTAVGATQAGNTSSAMTGITNQTASTGITNQSATTGVTTTNTGSGSSIATLPPYGTFIKIIKT